LAGNRFEDARALDSDVILSGLVSWRRAPRLILDILSLDLPALSGLTGRCNLIEIERNIGKKMPDARPAYRRYLPKLKFEVISVPTPEEVASFRGAVGDKDLPVIVSVVNGQADYFVTGDKNLISQIGPKDGFPFKTVSPADLLDKMLPAILGGNRLIPL
jgi:predicted nucleic acid-binding protein